MSSETLKTTLYKGLFLGVFAYAVFTSTVGGQTYNSADLYALWLAAHFMEAGQLDQIYPQTQGVFEMLTPSAWWEYAYGRISDPSQLRIYPYIYPPLWVSLLAPLTRLITFPQFDCFMLIFNQVLVMATCGLATRMMRLDRMKTLAVFTLSYAGIVSSIWVLLALSENQPQIFVSFLIVLAFERAQSDRPIAAGIALALAASIKLYPLLFVVVFLARRQTTATLSFVGAGAALALASVALAGWPLHVTFLHLIKDLSQTVVIANTTFSLDALIAGVGLLDQTTYIAPPWEEETQAGWWIFAKPAVWKILSGAATLLMLGLIARSAARQKDDPLVLALAATCVALLSPLSWTYTYFTAFVFLGAVPLRLGKPGWIGVAVIGLFSLRSIPRAELGGFESGLLYAWLVGILCMVLMAILFATALKHPNPVSQQDEDR